MVPFVGRRYVFTGNGVFVCKTNVGQQACRIEDFSRFTFSLSRRSITLQTLSNTLWAASSTCSVRRAEEINPVRG
jgi:hypothetical protein